MTSKKLGKVAVVTGGSAGIAEHFVRKGARVFITGRHQPASIGTR
jgi:NAD(P)-dependent dehydrogenase (short-subunit alcohol dehydrogenase family)